MLVAISNSLLTGVGSLIDFSPATMGHPGQVESLSCTHKHDFVSRDNRVEMKTNS